MFVFLHYVVKLNVCMNNREKARIDVINIFTSEDMENTPRGILRQFRMNFTSGVFSSYTLVCI